MEKENKIYETLLAIPKTTLVSILADISVSLLCNPDGQIAPEDSLAGGSAADFVASVGYTLDIVGVNEDCHK
jgi:hypothetical protein